jgi:hypothetical protein
VQRSRFETWVNQRQNLPFCDNGTVADITESLDEMIGKVEESGFDFDGLNRIAKS